MMKLRYGYFSVNKNLTTIWKECRRYWNSQKNIKINEKSSFATEQIAKMNLSRKRAIKQSEQYYLKFIAESNQEKKTLIRVCFEYLGDSLFGTEAKMTDTLNNWIIQYGVNPIKFQKTPNRDYEKIFVDAFEEVHEGTYEPFFCPHCGAEIEFPILNCPKCNSLLDLV